MDIQVLLEPMGETGFRASALSLIAEGTTEDDAIAQLKAIIVQRLATGAKVVTMPIPQVPAWAKHTSTRTIDDPFIQEYLEVLAENRRKADAEENPI